MVSSAMPNQRKSLEDDYGLSAVAQHNAAATIEKTPEGAKGLGLFDVSFGSIRTPPTPLSNTGDGVRTRSGRSTRRTESPASTNKSRISKSPAAKAKKDQRAKQKGDKAKTPKLTAPLSVLTKDMDTPVKDMDAWVNRPAEVRREEAGKRNGYITRPMNSFMLYRSAYADRTKQWCLQNNHQVVSSVSGESWPMEPQEVRDQFNEWAKVERANHAAAHPEYKFSPSKPATKRRRGDFSDDEDEATDVENDPDGEYRGGRSLRQKRQPVLVESTPINETVGSASNPYFDQRAGGYEQMYQFANPGRPLPSNVTYDQAGMSYNARTGQYIPAATQQSYSYALEARPNGLPTTNGTNRSDSSIGGYGLPTGPLLEDFLADSRSGTPMQHFDQYGQPVYQYGGPTYQHQVLPYSQPLHRQQMFEHQQYLQAASQPQAVIDPSLDADFEATHSQNHFEAAMGDMHHGDFGVLTEFPEYFDETTSPNAALGPAWSPTDIFK